MGEQQIKKCYRGFFNFAVDYVTPPTCTRPNISPRYRPGTASIYVFMYSVVVEVVKLILFLALKVDPLALGRRLLERLPTKLCQSLYPLPGSKTFVHLHLGLDHPVHQLKLALSNLDYLLDQPRTNLGLKVRNPAEKDPRLVPCTLYPKPRPRENALISRKLRLRLKLDLPLHIPNITTLKNMSQILPLFQRPAPLQLRALIQFAIPLLNPQIFRFRNIAQHKRLAPTLDLDRGRPADALAARHVELLRVLAQQLTRTFRPLIVSGGHRALDQRQTVLGQRLDRLPVHRVVGDRLELVEGRVVKVEECRPRRGVGEEAG